MDEKFTPQEIAESLRMCSNPVPCNGCTSIEHKGNCDCADWLKRTAADLIEAQAKRIAELEELVKDRTKDVLFYVEREKWIPTAERLPSPDDGPYSTYEDVSAVEVLAVIEGAEWATTLYFDGYDFFDLQGDEAIPYRATHWKPMPKGPEVGHD